MSSRRDKNRKIRRLKSKLAYFRSALAEMKEIQPEYESEWARDSQMAIRSLAILPTTEEKGRECEGQQVQSKNMVTDFDLNSDNPRNKVEDFSKDAAAVEKNEDPGWAKDLFRKIARRTHPDVNKNSDLIDYFRTATESMESQNYSRLIDIALDLGLDPNVNQVEMSNRLSERIEKINSKVKEIEKSFSWLWGESFGLEEIRVDILKAFLESKEIEFEESSLLGFVKSLSDS